MVAKLLLLQFVLFGCNFVKHRKMIFTVVLLRLKSFCLFSSFRLKSPKFRLTSSFATISMFIIKIILMQIDNSVNSLINNYKRNNFLNFLVTDFSGFKFKKLRKFPCRLPWSCSPQSTRPRAVAKPKSLTLFTVEVRPTG